MAHLGDLPAFPVPTNASEAGVSRRDWFAAVALQGIASKGLEVSEDRVLTDDDKNEIMAKRAYAMADAMVAASVSMRPKRKIVKKTRTPRKPVTSLPATSQAGTDAPELTAGDA